MYYIFMKLICKEPLRLANFSQLKKLNWHFQNWKNENPTCNFFKNRKEKAKLTLLLFFCYMLVLKDSPKQNWWQVWLFSSKRRLKKRSPHLVQKRTIKKMKVSRHVPQPIMFCRPKFTTEAHFPNFLLARFPPILYSFLSMAFWGPAMYFFLTPPYGTNKSPAESRYQTCSALFFLESAPLFWALFSWLSAH